MRGARLKNTPYIIGIVVYTGNDTKQMRNSETGANKMSKLEQLTNQLILYIMLCQCVLSLVIASYNFIWNYKNNEDHWYVDLPFGILNEAIILFGTHLILFNTFIPISLVITLEFVKLCQAYYINCDLDMYSEEKERYAKAFSSTINEELGQVQYVFSDKTGTLTCNEMKFKIALIGNHLYGDL